MEVGLREEVTLKLEERVRLGLRLIEPEFELLLVAEELSEIMGNTCTHTK